MAIMRFAAVYGAVFLIVGIIGFIPALSPDHNHPGLAIDAQSRLVLGLFPVNVVHNLVHVAFGVWGLMAARSLPGSRLYARAVAVIYGLLAVMGLIPGLNTMFGLVPLHGNDVWLHLLLAAGAAWFGFVQRSADPADTRAGRRPTARG